MKEKCQTCKKLFSRDELMKNGNGLFLCRPCNKKHARKYAATETGRNSIYKAVYKSILKYKEKQKARDNLAYHLSKKHIVKPLKCESCRKEKKLHGHHTDYAKPLQVTWLCKSCHSKIHRKLLR